MKKNINTNIDNLFKAGLKQDSEDGIPSLHFLTDLVDVTADNIFLRLPTDQELRDNAVTNSGIITGYIKSKAEMHYDVLAVGPNVNRCKVGDVVVVEAHKLTGISARNIGNFVYFTVRDFDILGVIK